MYEIENINKNKTKKVIRKKRLIPGREMIFLAIPLHLMLQQIICTLTNDVFFIIVSLNPQQN